MLLLASASQLVVPSTEAAAAAAPCSDYKKQTGACPPSAHGGLSGGNAKITARSSGSGPGNSDAKGVGNFKQNAPAAPVAPTQPDETPFYTDGCNPRCEFTVNNDEGDEDAPAGGVVVDLNDIARFRPTVGVDRMEPNGWMVIDLPANFYSRGGVVVKAGELFDRDALVRFTPVRWHWDYGDGAQRTSNDPGASWKTLGVDEFEPTGTSHVFDHAGTFEIRLTIFYAAEYQFDGNGWIPIAGVLPVPSNVIEARAVTAKTVLVAEDCTDNPTGPGC